MSSKPAKKSSSGSSSGSSSKEAKKSPADLIVRPAKVTTANSAKAYVALETLRDSGLDAGSYIQIAPNVVAVATPQAIDPDTCQLSAELLAAAELFPGDRLALRKAAKPATVDEITAYLAPGADASAAESLVRAVGLVHTGQWLGKDVLVGAPLTAQLANLSLNDASGSVGPHLVSTTTKIEFKPGSTQTSAFANVGGLSKELDLLRSQTELPLRFPQYFARFNTEPERGILLYGPPGTGKTMLLKAMARDAQDVHILRVNGPSLYSKYLGESESKLRAVFEEAERFAPAIIFVDEIDALAPKRDGDDTGETESRVVATLLTLMDGMKPGGRVVLVGATNRPNKLDPALRRPGRLGQEIEIGIPDAHGRRQILELMLGRMPHHLGAAEITDLADKTHGYVGADLQALVREAVLNVVKHGLKQERELTSMFVGKEDLDAAFLAVQPSAMREIALELPKVHWSDIGGQSTTIQRLRETVEWPIQRRDAFDRLGISPPRGVLLYGPPGCSKTLLAKALATEAGLNFLAVKGPELFNKYVGESERAIREVFHKARQAAPSIIFFDEIDALSVARGEGEAGGDRVLTSLLNEMDGIEALNEVVVLAATNRPDVIDSALMRPGRLDRLIYVSPPDLEARRQILLIQFAKMAIDDDVDLDALAHATAGFSSAELVNVCQEAGLLALNADPDAAVISQVSLDAAVKGIKRMITPEMVKYFENFASPE